MSVQKGSPGGGDEGGEQGGGGGSEGGSAGGGGGAHVKLVVHADGRKSSGELAQSKRFESEAGQPAKPCAWRRWLWLV